MLKYLNKIQYLVLLSNLVMYLSCASLTTPPHRKIGEELTLHKQTNKHLDASSPSYARTPAHDGSHGINSEPVVYDGDEEEESDSPFDSDTITNKTLNTVSNAVSSQVDKRYFDWPIDEARLTRGYSANPVPHPKRRRKKRPHWGIDLAAYRGTPIYASHHGKISYSGRDFKGYGKMILIEGENGWASIYAHLDKIIAKEGQKVRQGDLIGLMGKTGRVTGVHLHFEIRQNKDAYDPLLFLPNGEKVLEQLSARN